MSKIFRLIALLAFAVIINRNSTAIAIENSDSDGDGFTDEQERAWATDPLAPASRPLLDAIPLAQWKLDQATGLTVADTSDHGQVAYLEGETKPAWDIDEAALTFDGNQNQLRVPHSAIVSPTNTFTLAIWIQTPVGSEGLIMGKWPIEGTKGSYGLALHSGRLALAMSFAGEYRPLFGTRIVTDGEWHFVAATCTGNEVSLYIDGVLDAQTHTGGSIDQINAPLLLGLMEGKLSDARIYHRALRQDELILLYELATRSANDVRTLRPRHPANETEAIIAISPTQLTPQQVIRLRATERVANIEVAR